MIGCPLYDRDIIAEMKTFLFLNRDIILDIIFLNGYILI